MATGALLTIYTLLYGHAGFQCFARISICLSVRQRKEQKKAMAQATIDNPLPPTPQKSQQIGGDVFTASPPQNSFSFGFDGFGFNF